MAIIVKEGGQTNIPTHPDGAFPAVCIDVIDYGIVEMTWQGQTKKKHRGCIRFFCGQYGTVQEEETGNEKQIPLWVDEYFTLTLDERGKLRPFLNRWRGRAFTEAELKGFDLEKLIGVPAFLQLSHNTKDGRTYCNIDAAIRLHENMGEPPKPPADYVRVKDRPKDDEKQAAGTTAGGSPFAEDDDLPF